LRGESGGPSEAGGGGATPSDPGASATIAMSTPNCVEVTAHRSQRYWTGGAKISGDRGSRTTPHNELASPEVWSDGGGPSHSTGSEAVLRSRPYTFRAWPLRSRGLGRRPEGVPTSVAPSNTVRGVHPCLLPTVHPLSACATHFTVYGQELGLALNTDWVDGQPTTSTGGC